MNKNKFNNWPCVGEAPLDCLTDRITDKDLKQEYSWNLSPALTQKRSRNSAQNNRQSFVLEV